MSCKANYILKYIFDVEYKKVSRKEIESIVKLKPFKTVKLVLF